MNKREIDRLLFAQYRKQHEDYPTYRKRFYARIRKIVRLKAKYQKKIDAEVDALHGEFKRPAIFALRVSILEHRKAQPAKGRRKVKISVRRRARGMNNQSTKAPKARKKRKGGQPSVQAVLRQYAPGVAKKLLSKNKEFIVKQAFGELKKMKGLARRLDYNTTTIFFTRNKQALGIKSELRRIRRPGSNALVPMNFFSQA